LSFPNDNFFDAISRHKKSPFYTEGDN